ncbi:MAG: glutathione S-transferase family protein [Acaryochloridaceae cyanobacterium RU_4_10]|nr:glutathione S-transferase family protein [Acaryochloridaceae cyanobacterium RU_4_10]
MAEVEIYSAILCPFAHRSRLTLNAKGISYTLIEIDLQNKPANFLEISPYGKVPVLKHGNNRVWESTIINEYLDETFPKPALSPKEPIQRAHARIWINFADTRLFATSAKLLYGSSPQQHPLLRKELTEHLLFIENQALQKVSDRSPYWLGSEISLVDFTYYPWFEQLSVLEHFRGFEFPQGLDRLKQWWAAVATLESVKSIFKAPEFYIETYDRLYGAMNA